MVRGIKNNSKLQICCYVYKGSFKSMYNKIFLLHLLQTQLTNLHLQQLALRGSAVVAWRTWDINSQLLT